MIGKEFDVEVTAWQIIDDRDFDRLVDALIELKTYRETTCDYCGLPLIEHADDRWVSRSCD